MVNGTTTRWPGFKVLALPASTTSPMNSWPRMSPFCIVGMNASYRCRSEPQIAVEVIRMIASRGLRISGSSTVSQRTSCLPCQVIAFIGLFPFALGEVALIAGAGGDFAGFHELLETVQVAPRLKPRFALEQLGDQRADRTTGWVVGDRRAHDRAALARVAELDPAAVGDIGIGRRVPSDLGPRDILGDDRFPAHRAPGRSLDGPA